MNPTLADTNNDHNKDDDVSPMYADTPLEAIQQDPLDVIHNLGQDLEVDITEHLSHIDSMSTIEQDPLDVIIDDPNLPLLVDPTMDEYYDNDDNNYPPLLDDNDDSNDYNYDDYNYTYYNKEDNNYDNDDSTLYPLVDNDYNTNDDKTDNDVNNNGNDVLYPPLSKVIHNTDHKSYNDFALMYADAPLEAMYNKSLWMSSAM